MVKKRQLDFQKTKLRPGKSLPKGRNVTNTAFKSKKINIPSQSRKEKSELTIEDCIKQASRAGPVSTREKAMNQLNCLIEKDENYFIYLSDICDFIKNNILEQEESLRNATFTVLKTVLERTDSMRISTFLPLFTNILSCAMTHVDLKIKRVSLKLLNVLLKNHPRLFCTSITILKSLLSLLSGSSYNTKSRKATQKTNFFISSGDLSYSQDWRISVLEHINMYLIAVLEILKGDIDEEDDEETNVIYWDRKNPVSFTIYRGGGLKPVDIEKALSKPKKKELLNPVGVLEFENGLLDVLSQIFIEEITGGTSKSDDELVDKEIIEKLCILFQVLSNFGEWVKMISDPDSELEESFTKNLNDRIFRNLLKFPFSTRGPVLASKSQGRDLHLPCVQLNLAVCYLFSAFIMKPNNIENFKNSMLAYLKSVGIMSYEIKYDCIPMLIKILRILLPYRYMDPDIEVIPDDFMHSILMDLNKMLKINDERPNKQLLVSFFLEVCLDIHQEYFVDSSVFSQLFDYMGSMIVSGKINKKFLMAIRKIGVRGNPSFKDSLEKISFDTFITWLTNDNADVIETAIYLIIHLKEIPFEYLFEFSRLILKDERFPRKKAFILLRFLTHRFSDMKTTPARDRVNFIVFLLNLAIDVLNIDEVKWDEYNNPKFRNIWSHMKSLVPYSIIPTLEWKKHEELFETCCECLSRLPTFTVNCIAVKLVKELVENRENLPAHCAIALLKLNNAKMMENSYYKCLMQDLIHSVLHFMSVMGCLDINDVWHENNVIPLSNCVPCTPAVAQDVLQQIEYDSHLAKEGIVVYHVLRVIKFLIKANLLGSESARRVISLLDAYKEVCIDTDITQQPLYSKLYNYFLYQM